MRNPGAAFTSIIPPPFSANGSETLGAITSTPATSRPIMRAIRSNRKMFWGWTSSVRSIAVPPVEMFAVVFRKRRSSFGKIDSRVYPFAAMQRIVCPSISIEVSTFSWPYPRRGSALTSSINCWIVRVPSPIICAGILSATAINLLFTTSARKSAPSNCFSTITHREYSRAFSNAMRAFSIVFIPTVAPFP
jgi:hypothetical protein